MLAVPNLDIGFGTFGWCSHRRGDSPHSGAYNKRYPPESQTITVPKGGRSQIIKRIQFELKVFMISSFNCRLLVLLNDPASRLHDNRPDTIVFFVHENLRPKWPSGATWIGFWLHHGAFAGASAKGRPKICKIRLRQRIQAQISLILTF